MTRWFIILFTLLLRRSASFPVSKAPSSLQIRGGADVEPETHSWGRLQKWFHSTSQQVYSSTVKPTIEKILPTKSGPVEMYEIFGVWRICLDEGDEILFFEIRPHEIAFGSKGNTIPYTFKEATWSSYARIEFKVKNKTYRATLRRRLPRSLKLKGEICNEGWWWKRSVGTFVGRKMAHRELKGDDAKAWRDDQDDDDCTATTLATADDQSKGGDSSSQGRPSTIKVKLKVD